MRECGENEARRYVASLAFVSLFTVAVIACALTPTALRAELEIEETGRSLSLPAEIGDHWVWAGDVVLRRTALFDADSGRMLGALNAGREISSGAAAVVEARPQRIKLPDERQAFTHKFSIAGHEGYLTVGLYDDGAPGEIFLRMAKEGSTVSGLMDTIAKMTSIALQYGVPLEKLVHQFSHTRFEPSGFTNNREIPIAKSVTDYVFRFLGNRYLSDNNVETLEQVEQAEQAMLGETSEPEEKGAVAGGSVSGKARSSHEMTTFVNQADAPGCMECGSIMLRNGACYKCPNCGSTSGCS